MNVIYRITYKPHLGTNFPKYYIGSKYNYKGNYFGSLASNQVFDYTEGESLKKWWKNRNKDDLLFEIIECLECTPQQLILSEREYQLQQNVLSPEFFNQTIANKGLFSKQKSEETRHKMSVATKHFWSSKEGLAKKQRLIERNKTIGAEQTRERWKNPTNNMLKQVEILRKTSRKGCKDVHPRRRRPTQLIKANKEVFCNAVKAGAKFNICPTVVRYYCRKKRKVKGVQWFYANCVSN
jgi:hypothetical protein